VLETVFFRDYFDDIANMFRIPEDDVRLLVIAFGVRPGGPFDIAKGEDLILSVGSTKTEVLSEGFLKQVGNIFAGGRKLSGIWIVFCGTGG
jgi:hypothetical protein